MSMRYRVRHSKEKRDFLKSKIAFAYFFLAFFFFSFFRLLSFLFHRPFSFLPFVFFLVLFLFSCVLYTGGAEKRILCFLGI